MRRRDLVLGFAAVGLAACSRGPDEALSEAGETPTGAAADPAASIRPLYDPYLTPDAPSPALVDQAPWSADLRARLEAMAARSQALNEPILDFDPLIGAQDHQLSNLAVTTDGVVENSHATVRAHFTNLGQEDEIVYDLIWEGGGWRVDNIRAANWDLRQIAAHGETQPAAP